MEDRRCITCRLFKPKTPLDWLINHDGYPYDKHVLARKNPIIDTIVGECQLEPQWREVRATHSCGSYKIDRYFMMSWRQFTSNIKDREENYELRKLLREERAKSKTERQKTRLLREQIRSLK